MASSTEARTCSGEVKEVTRVSPCVGMAVGVTRGSGRSSTEARTISCSRKTEKTVESPTVADASAPGAASAPPGASISSVPKSTSACVMWSQPSIVYCTTAGSTLSTERTSPELRRCFLSHDALFLEPCW